MKLIPWTSEKKLRALIAREVAERLDPAFTEEQLFIAVCQGVTRELTQRKRVLPIDLAAKVRKLWPES